MTLPVPHDGRHQRAEYLPRSRRRRSGRGGRSRAPRGSSPPTRRGGSFDVAHDVVEAGEADLGTRGGSCGGPNPGRTRRHSRCGRGTCAPSRRRCGSPHGGWRRARRCRPRAGARAARRGRARRRRPASASSTRKQMSRTPSPWACTCSAIGESGVSAPVTMKRMRPCCSTCDTRSRRPVSAPSRPRPRTRTPPPGTR